MKCIKYRKIPKISPWAYICQTGLFEGLIFGGAYFPRGLSTKGNLRFKIDWASLIVGSKFSVFALFYFVFEENFPSTSPQGAYIWRGDLTEGFWRYQFGSSYLEALIFGILRYSNNRITRLVVPFSRSTWISYGLPLLGNSALPGYAHARAVLRQFSDSCFLYTPKKILGKFSYPKCPWIQNFKRTNIVLSSLSL